jgi:hypothetical protein
VYRATYRGFKSLILRQKMEFRWPAIPFYT